MAENSLFKKVFVLITTHNRTNVACACIESLVKNLKYGNLGWIVSDDRSDEGHVEVLVEKFRSLGVNDVQVCRTNSKRWGLGASLNNGLSLAFKSTDVVLTTEDDWYLQKELKLDPYVRIFDIDQNVGCIRLGPMMYAKLTRHHRYRIFDKVYSDGGLYTSVFNNQVALRHKRIYKNLGAYKENCPCDFSEQDMIARYNCGCMLDVLYPNFLKAGTMDDPSHFFIHVGKSTCGHDNYAVPDRFKWIYDEEAHTTPPKKDDEEMEVVNEAPVNINDRDLPTVTVIITTHNRTNVACATIESLVKNLVYPKLKWCIADDRSDEGHVEKLVRAFHENGIEDVHVEKTNNKRWGLGASLNSGLSYAWTHSCYALRTEDDWILEKRLDISDHVRLMETDANVDMIRLAYLDEKQKTVDYDDKFYKIEKSSFNYNFNNQVCILHKRIYDFLGDNPENCTPPEQETEMRLRYNKMTDCGNSKQHAILFEKRLKKGSLDDNSLDFIHVGISTMNHAYDCPSRYQYIYNDMTNLSDKVIDEANIRSIVEDTGRKIVVTMTSWVKRIENCRYVLNKILENTLKPDTIFLNLSVQEFPKKCKDLPKDLVGFIQKNETIQLNWVSGQNTKSMKKVYPILNMISDDDMILICDDDLDIPSNFVYLRVKEFLEHNCLFPISGGTNPRYHLNLPLHNTKYNSLTTSSIFTKRMLSGYKEVWTKDVIETYKDDTIHTLLCLSNGFHPIPSRYLSTYSGITKQKIPFYNDVCGMRDNHMWKSDKDTIEIFEKAYSKAFKHSFHESLFNLVIWDSYDVAGDNGECFYRKVQELHPHIMMTFLISKNSKDWNRLKADGFNLYPFEGRDVGTIIDNASYIVWSKDIPKFNGTFIMDFLKVNRDRSIFVPHGRTSMIYDCSPYFKGLSNYTKFSCCVSDEEAKVVSEYTDGKIIPLVTGFPRHDIILKNLSDFRQKPRAQKQILISFHHRPGLRNLEPEGFKKTNYCVEINRFLNSNELRALTNIGIKVSFITHAMLKSLDGCFNVPKWIELANDKPFQQMFIESDLLITDFSSTSFEFALMNKPTIVFIPDINDVRTKLPRYHLNEIRNYRHLTICETPSDVCVNAMNLMNTKPPRRYDVDFSYVDQNNSKRLIDVLTSQFLSGGELK